jgi:hypothetical protein
MPEHDYYEQLCMLPVAELSLAEQEEVRAHLAICAECVAAHGQVRKFREILPLAEQGFRHFFSQLRQSRDVIECRETFVAQARARGVTLSDAARDALRVAAQRYSLSLTPILQFCAVAAFASVVTFGLMSVRASHISNRPAGVSGSPSALVPGGHTLDDAALGKQLEDLREKTRLLSTDLDTQNAKTQEALQERDAAKSALSPLIALNEELRRHSDDLERSLKLSDEAREQLDQKLQMQIQAASAARTELNSLRGTSTKDQASLIEQAAQVQELSREVKLQQADLDREKELLSDGRDIREVMGARNLHILDVNDFDSKGNRKNAFGRIFYTEGKSLIFYAFDLYSSSRTNASFQVWGHNEAQRSVTNLGIFFMDDQKQSRWVLRVNDPDVLAQIDSVFVTVERPGGAKRPTGDKRLYAYLGHPANHP